MQLEHTFTVPAGVEQAWQVLLDIERVAPCMPGASLDTVDGDDFTGTVKVRLGPIGLTYKGKASFVEKDEVARRVVIDAQGRDSRGNGTASAKVTATLQPDGEQATKVAVLTDLNITGKPAQFGRGVMVDVGNKLIGQFADCLAGKLAGTDAAATDETTMAEAALAETAATETAAAETAAAELPAVAAPGAPPTAAPAAMAGGSGPASAMPASAVPADSDSGEQPAVDVAAGTQATADSTAPGTDPVAPDFSASGTSSDAGSAPSTGARQVAPTEVEPIDLLGSAGPAVAKRLAPIAAAVAVVVALLVILRRRGR